MQDERELASFEVAFRAPDDAGDKGEAGKWGLSLSTTRDDEEADVPEQDGIVGRGKERSAVPLSRSSFRPFLPGGKKKKLDVMEEEEGDFDRAFEEGGANQDDGASMRAMTTRRVFEKNDVSKRDFGSAALVEGEEGRDRMYKGFNVADKLPLRVVGQEQARGLTDTFDQATRSDVVFPVHSEQPAPLRGKVRRVGARNVASRSEGVGKKGREAPPSRRGAREASHGVREVVGALSLKKSPHDALQGRGSSGLVPGRARVRPESGATFSVPDWIPTSRKRASSATGVVMGERVLGSGDSRRGKALDALERDHVGTGNAAVADPLATKVEPTRKLGAGGISGKTAPLFDARSLRNAVVGLFATSAQDSRATIRAPTPTRATSVAPAGDRERTRSTKEATSELRRRARGHHRETTWAGGGLPTKNVLAFSREGVGRNSKASPLSRVVPDVVLDSSSAVARTFRNIAAALPSSRNQAQDVFSFASLFGQNPRSSHVRPPRPRDSRQLHDEVDTRAESFGIASFGRQMLQAATTAAEGVLTNFSNDRKEARTEGLGARNRESVLVARPVPGRLPELIEKEEISARPAPLFTGRDAKIWRGDTLVPDTDAREQDTKEEARNLATAGSAGHGARKNFVQQRGALVRPKRDDAGGNAPPPDRPFSAPRRDREVPSTVHATARCAMAGDEEGDDEADDMQRR